MSSYIKTVCQNKTIPFDKQDELKERLNILAYASGAMEVNFFKMFGGVIKTIHPCRFDENGMQTVMNYFSEMRSTNRENYLFYSNEVDDSFVELMRAAHILETLYLEEDAVVLYDCQPILHNEKYYISWFNYLFDEKYTLHHWDKWKAYLLMKDEKGFCRDNFDKTFETGFGYYPMISNCEVLALEYGLEELNKELSREEYKNVFFIKGIQDIRSNIQEFKDNSDMTVSDQIDLLIECTNQYIAEKHELLDENKDNIDLENINVSLMIMDSPILAAIAMSEVYETDFWDLYKRLDKYEERRFYSREMLDEPLLPISTADLFDLDPDDMIYYWSENGDINFSEELKQWFEELAEQYQEILNKKIQQTDPMKWVINLISFADRNYYMIMPFTEFLCETFQHYDDARYLALWRIFQNMCMDEEMYKQGSVLFELEDDDERDIKLDLLNSKRGPLKNSWWLSYGEEIKNPARVKLLRYLALIANKELRQIVFGF